MYEQSLHVHQILCSRSILLHLSCHLSVHSGKNYESLREYIPRCTVTCIGNKPVFSGAILQEGNPRSDMTNRTALTLTLTDMNHAFPRATQIPNWLRDRI